LLNINFTQKPARPTKISTEVTGLLHAVVVGVELTELH